MQGRGDRPRLMGPGNNMGPMFPMGPGGGPGGPMLPGPGGPGGPMGFHDGPRMHDGPGPGQGMMGFSDGPGLGGPGGPGGMGGGGGFPDGPGGMPPVMGGQFGGPRQGGGMPPIMMQGGLGVGGGPSQGPQGQGPQQGGPRGGMGPVGGPGMPGMNMPPVSMHMQGPGGQGPGGPQQQQQNFQGPGGPMQQQSQQQQQQQQGPPGQHVRQGGPGQQPPGGPGNMNGGRGPGGQFGPGGGPGPQQGMNMRGPQGSMGMNQAGGRGGGMRNQQQQGPSQQQQGFSQPPGGGSALLQQARGGTGYRAPGSQSAAPGAKEVKNDYSQQFVDTGQRPQNYLRDALLTDRYEDYPDLKRLVSMKDEMVAKNITPSYWLKLGVDVLYAQADLKHLKLSPETFGTKFDVILIDPPWEEYVRRAPHAPGMTDQEVWTWQEIQALNIEAIADNPSFVFLWCGTAEGLDAGRHCLQKWGFRRVEDIVWIKTNKERNPRTGYLQTMNQEPYSVLTHTKEHCLMGMKGSLRRNQDGHVIHANCDTDIIVSEEPAGGSTEKPLELYQIIERFCLGKRRLELFGEEHNRRDGWVTVGRQLHTTNFRPDVYASHFKYPDGRMYVENTTGGRIPRGAPMLIPTPQEVEDIRPKSPPKRHRCRRSSRYSVSCRGSDPSRD